MRVRMDTGAAMRNKRSFSLHHMAAAKEINMEARRRSKSFTLFPHFMKDKQKTTLHSFVHPRLALGKLCSVCSVVPARQGALHTSGESAVLLPTRSAGSENTWLVFFLQRHTRFDTSKCFCSSLTPECLTPPQIEQCYSCHVSHGWQHSTWPVRLGGGDLALALAC